MYDFFNVILVSTSVLPVFLYLVDGYKGKDMKKAIMLILLFFAFIISGVLGVSFFGLRFVYAVPLIIALFVVFSKQ